MRQALIEKMLYVTLALVFIGATFLGIAALKAVEEFTRQQEVLQQQVSGQKEVLKGMKELISNQGQTTDDINNSLSCILIFFSKPDRATFYISDLSTCTLTNTSTGKTEVLPLQPNINQLPADDVRRNDDVGLESEPQIRDTSKEQTRPSTNSPPAQSSSPTIAADLGLLKLSLDLPSNLLRR